ncbi:unnamed protein product [Pylaiella littoralis]
MDLPLLGPLCEERDHEIGVSPETRMERCICVGLSEPQLQVRYGPSYISDIRVAEGRAGIHPTTLSCSRQPATISILFSHPRTTTTIHRTCPALGLRRGNTSLHIGGVHVHVVSWRSVT